MPHRTPISRSSRRPRRQAGFTLVEIMIVVLIIGVLLNIALPSFVGARDKSRAQACIKNLNDFQVAKEQYAMDNKIPASSTTAVTWSNLTPYVRTSPFTDPVLGPLCPASTTIHYSFNTLAVPPSCPYYASAANPLAIHALTN